MPKAREMQGVPSHIEYIKVQDKGRHPAHCKHHIGKGKSRICTNTNSPIYNQHCGSSVHCDYYKDDRY